MTKHLQFVLLIFLLAISWFSYALPTAKVTIKVIDENNMPIEDVHVEVYFKLEGNRSNTDYGVTDDQGLFEASGSTLQYVGGCNIEKDGYYPGGCNYSERNLTSISGIMGFRRWQPWNPTITVVLKKIKEPVALYMRNLGQWARLGDKENTMPDFEVGYDLVESDWVMPHGRGTHSDFIFKIDKSHVTDFNYRDKLTVTFSNPGDGIQPYYTAKDNASTFKMPYHAPLEGYDNQLVQIDENDPKKIFRNIFREDQNYFFRVRTELDEKGNVVSALYGKIEGNIMFAAPNEIKAAWLEFKYFLNPTPNDTNLEFDRTKNLFGDKFIEKR